jgi:hypothetical protein
MAVVDQVMVLFWVSGPCSGGITTRRRNTQPSHHWSSLVLWLRANALSTIPILFVLCCCGQCIEWPCISGIVPHDFDVFDVARVECEVYLMEATQIKFRGAGFAVESFVIVVRRRRIPQTNTTDPSLMLIPGGLIQRPRPKSRELRSLHI